MSPDNHPGTPGRPKGDYPRRVNLSLSALDFAQVKVRAEELGISNTQFIRDAVAMALGRRQRQRSHPGLEAKLSNALHIFAQDRVLRYNTLTAIRDQLREVAKIHGPLPFASFDAKLTDNIAQTLDDIIYGVEVYTALKGKMAPTVLEGAPSPC